MSKASNTSEKGPTPASKPGLGERLFNRLMTLRNRLGMAPPTLYELDVVGRKSGKVRSTPVTLLSVDSGQFLVAPRGEVQWVINARAAGDVVLRQAKQERSYTLEEVVDSSKASLLKTYLERFAPAVGQHFPIDANSSLDEFSAIAHAYPVFRLIKTQE
ncbi:MAG: nitroreductase family deazaflavin-dependent oxidoreductase [Pseudomonadaceae bacterium]|nr:nitroreductase family deazaflavin-dependent oxidoreductase [Pseudomonadaceae bacterium]